MSEETLAGHFSVEASARLVRQYRYAEERLMRVMAGWIALTPELPAKLVLGRHVWDCAQHADAWGRRLPELRAPAQQSEPANEAFVAFVDLLDSRDAPGQTVERLSGVYGVFKPHLVAVYASHLARANPIYEPPTRRILARCLDDERRHVAAGAAVLDRLAVGAAADRAARWTEELREALRRAGGVTGTDPEPAFEAARREVDISNDVIALDSRFERDRVPEDLAGAVRSEYADGEIVACAKIGQYRLVRVRARDSGGVRLVQTQWRRADGTWRLVASDVVRTDPA
jgi:1,2-phenylacetyl-CoA epoxidase catalytic subunit